MTVTENVCSEAADGIIMSLYDDLNEIDWLQNCGLFGNFSSKCDTCNDWNVKLVEGKS